MITYICYMPVYLHMISPPHPSLPFVFIDFLWERNIDNFVHTLSFFTFIPLFVWRAYTMVKVSLRLIFTSLRYQFVSIRTYIYVFTFFLICIYIFLSRLEICEC